MTATFDSVSKNYSHTQEQEDGFMSPSQLTYFKARLERWKKDILQDHEATMQELKTVSIHHPDLMDCASSESDWSIEFRKRDRQRKLISKIDDALVRIQNGSYGYCEETGEPIGIQRLEARPVATLSIEAQERREREEKMHRDGAI